MPKGWTDKHEYKLLKGRLAAMDDRVFERAVLPLLRIIWPKAIGPPARRTFDRSGVDHLVWSDKPPHTLVVQCKGFQALEWEIGQDQILQCVDSIRSFHESGLTAATYLLVHNRIGKDKRFRDTIQKELIRLVDAGKAHRAELWDLDRLLKSTFAAMFERVKRAFASRNLSISKIYADVEPDLCDPISEVPLQIRWLIADQYRMRSSSEEQPRIGDPAEELLNIRSNLCILVGYAGFGKTTTTLRMAKYREQRVVYVPAAIFSRRLNGTKDLLQQCVDTDELLTESDENDGETWRRVARAAIEHLFKMDEGSLVLLIDGLDESVFFNRRGGLQQLFNALRLVRSRIVLTVRKEYWDARIADFETSVGTITNRDDRIRNQKIAFIELLPWRDDQIVGLARRFCDTLSDPESVDRVRRFIEAIDNGDYAAIYGDIPRRPLFLRFILETVATLGVHAVDRAQLFLEWARLKICRDVSRPAQLGGNRIPIVADEEGTDATMELAFLAMGWAARWMTATYDRKLQLLPSCPAETVLASSPRLAACRDVTGLLLNSLLIPARPRASPEPLELAFAHRAYQEYFLARFLREQPGVFGDVEIPEPVKEWLRLLEHRPAHSSSSQLVD